MLGACSATTCVMPRGRMSTSSGAFWQGYLAGWLYAVTLLIAALITRISGSDLLTVLRDLVGPAR